MFSTQDAYNLMRVVSPAVQLGMPAITAEQLVNKMLVEGRGDAGANQYDTNNPRANALYKSLLDQGHYPKAATFAAAVLATTERANKLGKSFEEVWNGLGKSKETGRTGLQHSQRYAASTAAATAPKNAQFLDYAKRAISGNLTPQEHLTEILPEAENTRLFGLRDLFNINRKIQQTADPKNSQEMAIASALASTKSPDTIAQQAVLNNYRQAVDVAPRPVPKILNSSEKQLADILTTLPAFQSLAQKALDSRRP
jgi:hypothetical protein